MLRNTEPYMAGIITKCYSFIFHLHLFQPNFTMYTLMMRETLAVKGLVMCLLLIIMAL